MRTGVHAQAKAAPTPSFTPAPTGILQRQCACGSKNSLGGECTTCQQKPFGLQRGPIDESASPAFSPRLGHDFGQVQVHRAASERIRPKLIVNAPGDRFEQEADRVADLIMRMPTAEAAANPSALGRFGGPPIQRLSDDPEQKVHRREEEKESGILSMSQSGRPLPPSVRAFMEARFRRDFSDVRVHTDSQAAQDAHDLKARAFTIGNDIGDCHSQ